MRPVRPDPSGNQLLGDWETQEAPFKPADPDRLLTQSPEQGARCLCKRASACGPLHPAWPAQPDPAARSEHKARLCLHGPVELGQQRPAARRCRGIVNVSVCMLAHGPGQAEEACPPHLVSCSSIGAPSADSKIKHKTPMCSTPMWCQRLPGTHSGGVRGATACILSICARPSPRRSARPCAKKRRRKRKEKKKRKDYAHAPAQPTHLLNSFSMGASMRLHHATVMRGSM